MSAIGSTRWRRLAVVAAAFAIVWLAFVVYLDVRYGKFPAVLVGGIKILVVAYALLLVAVAAVAGLRRLFRKRADC